MEKMFDGASKPTLLPCRPWPHLSLNVLFQDNRAYYTHGHGACWTYCCQFCGPSSLCWEGRGRHKALNWFMDLDLLVFRPKNLINIFLHKAKHAMKRVRRDSAMSSILSRVNRRGSWVRTIRQRSKGQEESFLKIFELKWTILDSRPHLRKFHWNPSSPLRHLLARATPPKERAAGRDFHRAWRFEAH